MKNEIKTWLIDIKKAIEEINSFRPQSYEKFKNDLKTKRAIERNIEIIGEAVNRILKADIEFPIGNSQKIVATRNRIIHGYDTVSEEIIWSIIINDLPELENDIHILLEKEE